MEIIDQRSVVLPGSNERVAEQRVLHQPSSKWLKQFSKEPRGQSRIHDNELAAGTKLFPNLTKNGTMLRHDVVGKAKKHAIKQFSTDELGGIGFNQHDVSPLPAMTQFPCPAQHPFRQIDTINPAFESDSISEIGQIPTGPTSHFEDSIAPSKF